MNHNETTIFFSKNISFVDKDQILRLSGIPKTKCYDSYLGLLALVGRSWIAAFKYITDRVWKCLQDWKLKFLSQVGKEILLKVVIHAIPTYCMIVFLLPKGLCLEIDAMM